jgi:hypothetical protein
LKLIIIADKSRSSNVINTLTNLQFQIVEGTCISSSSFKRVFRYFDSIIADKLDSDLTQRLAKKDDLSNFIKNLVPILVSKTGDMNPRNQKDSVRSLRKICSNKNVNLQWVLPSILEPIKSKNAVKVWTGRMYLIESLVKELHLKPKGQLETEKIMPLVVEALQSVSPQIRTSAMNVCKEIYKEIGESIFDYCKSIKSATLTVCSNSHLSNI